jgi:orotate phosphoribosyltransferase
MTNAETRLLELIRQRAFRRGTFRLASGDTSSYYIDGKSIEVYSESAPLIGEVLYEHTQDLQLDAIGGLEVGAVPLTTAAVISYAQHGRKIEGFWVRDRVKDHGTQKLIEGVALQPGWRVGIVEDVVTRGSSALKAIDAVKNAFCEIVLVIALVDRLQGAEHLFRERGVANYRRSAISESSPITIRPGRKTSNVDVTQSSSPSFRRPCVRGGRRPRHRREGEDHGPRRGIAEGGEVGETGGGGPRPLHRPDERREADRRGYRTGGGDGLEE